MVKRFLSLILWEILLRLEAGTSQVTCEGEPWGIVRVMCCEEW